MEALDCSILKLGFFFHPQVIAEESAPFSHLRHNATVTVILKDVNEFNPEFNQTIYSASVKESEVIGTRVLTVSLSTELYS